MNLICAAVMACIVPQGTAPPQKPVLYRPYQEVVTSEAKSQDGIFKVHQVDEKFYFEIPKDMLGKDMLWQAQEKAIPSVLGSPGVQDNRLVQWTRRGAKVYLMAVDYTLEGIGPEVKRSVDSVAIPGVIATFKVEAEGAGSSVVIDVSDFLISDPNDLQIAPSWNAALQRNRSYVEKVKAFPENVEIRSLLTFQLARQTIFPGTAASYSGSVGPNVSVLMHYSFVLLPEKPMMARYRDFRVGYFGILKEQFGSSEHRPLRRELIRRFRLEKKDPSAALSEPVSPIVFYIAREWPQKWRSYVKKGVEAWQPAFAQAGFKNAILCKEAPSEEENPDWDQEDARHSMIRFTTTSIENAFGLQIVDPRSGEVISGQVVFYHNFLNFLQNMYFVQASPLDPAARQLPFSDALMGTLLQYIITHEIGHSIGLEHNMKSSSSYTIAQLRDPAYVAKNDIASSIMDYARFNYVSQPGDGVSLIRGLGQYDKFAIEWGYKPIPGAETPEEEIPELNKIAARQNSNPYLRFGNYIHPEDPATQTEDLSNDPIAATRLGLLNLNRAAKLLVPASVRKGTNLRLMANAYVAMLMHHGYLMDNILMLVGGVYAHDHEIINAGMVYQPVPREKQRAAVKFVCGPEALPPKELVSPDLVNRLYPSGDVGRITRLQSPQLASLFGDARIGRLIDQEAALGGKAYTVKMLLEDVQNSVWRQLSAKRPMVSITQRQFQRDYLATLDGKLNGPAATKTDLQGLGRASLRTLAHRIDKAIPISGDQMTSIHLQECRRQIEAILKGTSPATRLPAVPAANRTAASGQANACFGWSGHQH